MTIAITHQGLSSRSRLIAAYASGLGTIIDQRLALQSASITELLAAKAIINRTPSPSQPYALLMLDIHLNRKTRPVCSK